MKINYSIFNKRIMVCSLFLSLSGLPYLLYANPNPDRIIINIITAERIYNGYHVASITDSSVTIYFKLPKSQNKRDSILTIDAKNIIAIKTRKRLATMIYILPPIIGAGAGIYMGNGQDKKYRIANPDRWFRLDGIYKVLYGFTGAVFGAFNSLIIFIDTHRQFNINLRPENFKEFKKYMEHL